MDIEKKIIGIGLTGSDGEFIKIEEYSVIANSKDKLRNYFEDDFDDQGIIKEVYFEEILKRLKGREAFLLAEDSYNKFIEYGEECDPLFEDNFMIIESQEDSDSGVDYCIKGFSS